MLVTACGDRHEQSAGIGQARHVRMFPFRELSRMPSEQDFRDGTKIDIGVIPVL